MVLKEMSWAGAITCFSLYCMVFLAVRHEMELETPSEVHSRLGLLMFTVPGAVAALTSRTSPLGGAILGALLAAPCCQLLLHLHFFSGSTFIQELAFAASAVFWCGSGALGVMLWRMLVPHRQ